MNSCFKAGQRLLVLASGQQARPKDVLSEPIAGLEVHSLFRQLDTYPQRQSLNNVTAAKEA